MASKIRPARVADFKRLRLAIDLLNRVREQLQALSPQAHGRTLDGMASVLMTTLWSALEKPWDWHGAPSARRPSKKSLK